MEKLLSRLRLANFVVAATAIATGLGIGVFFWKSLPSAIPLFYSLPWGEEQLVAPVGLLWPIGLATSVTIMCVIATRWLKSEQVLAVMVAGSGIMIGIILILGLLRSVMLIV